MPTSSQWYDRYRKCEDGNSHEGKLELITWPSTAGQDRMGWGNCLATESDELKEKFDEKFELMKGSDLRVQYGLNHFLERSQVIASLDLVKRDDVLPGLRQVHWDLREAGKWAGCAVS